MRKACLGILYRPGAKRLRMSVLQEKYKGGTTMTGSIKAKTKLRLREMLDEAIAQGVTAGVSLGIWQDGEELFFTAQGYADQEAKRPMERNTIHRLYSMSKPVTAAAQDEMGAMMHTGAAVESMIWASLLRGMLCLSVTGCITLPTVRQLK